MTLHNVVLTAHILIAIVTIGWLSMQAMLMPRMIRSGNAGAVRFGASAAEKIGPLAALVFVLGLWLVGIGGAEFKDKWVGAAMLLFILAILNGAVLIGGAERRAATKLENGEQAPDEAKRIAMLGGVNMLILITIVYLMVAKPGA